MTKGTPPRAPTAQAAAYAEQKAAIRARLQELHGAVEQHEAVARGHSYGITWAHVGDLQALREKVDEALLFMRGEG